MPLRILHLLGSADLEATGINRMVSALTRSLDPVVYETHAWFLADDGPFVDELTAAGAHVRVLGWRSPIDGPAAARLLGTFRRDQFQLVHQHWGGRLVRYVARRGSPRLVCHLHDRRSILPAWFDVLGRPDAVAATSHFLADQVRPTARVLHPGVPSLAKVNHQPAPVIGTASRLVQEKGIQHLVSAFAELQRQRPAARLQIAGMGPYEPDLRKLAEGVPGIDFLGWRTDLLEVMAGWSVFAFPTLTEGFGIAPLEAMSRGLPVVASRTGGLPELIEEGATGFLVPPADPRALADRLVELLDRPELARAMGETGWRRARACFSEERMLAAWQQLYEDVLTSAPSPAPATAPRFPTFPS